MEAIHPSSPRTLLDFLCHPPLSSWPSFLTGMEVAASLVGKAAQLQVVEREELPYLLTLGGQVGTVAMKVGKGKQSHSNEGCCPGGEVPRGTST